MRVVNRTRSKLLGERVERADRLLKRMKGLLGRSGLAEGEGLWISPCNSIHTAFMRFAIVIVFLDSSLCVVRIIEQMQPWRLSRLVVSARSVLELPAGSLQATGTQVGDSLVFEEL